jgi:ankyrin repeat protein
VKGNLEMMTLLLDHGADVEARFQGGGSAIGLAGLMTDIRIARLLLQRGANIMAREDAGGTALHGAANLATPK